jgi:putative transposase
MTQSMSRRGNCWDNAVAESFFSTLKKQAVHVEQFATRCQAKLAIFEYIESCCNRIRRHSTIGWLSPLKNESLYYRDLKGVTVHLND